jgi:hypothetical protein
MDVTNMVLPCDLPQWSEVKTLFNEVLLNKSAECLIASLQKIYDKAHERKSSSAIECAAVAARPKAKSLFSGLKTFLDKKATAEEYDEFFNIILPTIIRMAMDIEKFADCLHGKNMCKCVDDGNMKFTRCIYLFIFVTSCLVSAAVSIVTCLRYGINCLRDACCRHTVQGFGSVVRNRLNV